MPLRIPSNQIKFNYTAGKEYMFISTHNEYQGHYYKFNGKTFAGKEFDLYAPELIKIPVDNKGSSLFNPLLTNAATYLYGKISNTQINNFTPTSIVGKVSQEKTIRYFTKKINNNPILIKEISKEDYMILQKQPNPLLQIINIQFPPGGYFADQKNLDEAEKQMPGIKAFILSKRAPD